MSHKGLYYILIIFIFVLCIYFLNSLKYASASLPVNMTLNATQVWWQDAINASGYTNATTVVTVFQGNTQACSTTSVASGFWSCTFTAPTLIGAYAYKANSSNTDYSSATNLNVFPFYGIKGIGSEPRVIYEVPFVIEDLNGNVQQAIVRVGITK